MARGRGGDGKAGRSACASGHSNRGATGRARGSHYAPAMAMRLRVARVEEWPPGRGKLVSVGPLEVMVCNLEGRLEARAAGAIRRAPVEECCPPGGLAFDALAEDAPSRLRDRGRALAV